MVIMMKKNNKKLLIGVLSLLIVCLIVILGLKFNKNAKIDSIIELEVNPSIELKIAKDGDIVDVNALNKDGKKVIKNLNLDDKDLDDAIENIIESMLKLEYITANENSILVSVKNDNKDKAEKLKIKITKMIQKILYEKLENSSFITQTFNDNKEIEKKANENNITDGKATLINKILDAHLKDHNDTFYTFESLADLSINELNLIISSKNADIKDITISGTASENLYIGKEKAKEAVLKDANVPVENIKYINVEFDADDGKMIYEIEFNTTNAHFEYEIDAKSGKVIDSDMNRIYENNNDNNIINDNSTNNRYKNKNNIDKNDDTIISEN